MNNQYKIVSLDLDGTLVEVGSDDLSAYTINVLKELKQRNIILIANTGRIRKFVPKDIVDIPVDYISCCNGARIFDNRTSECIKKCEIDTQTSYELISYLTNNHYIYSCIIDDEIRTSGYNNTIAQDIRDHLKTGVIEHDDLANDILKDNLKIEKLSIRCTKDQKKGIYEDISKNVRNVTLASSQPGLIDVNYTNATKGNSLKYICNLNNIPLNKSVACGDDINDLSILKIAGLSLVPSEADNEVRKYANIIAGPRTDSGVAKELVKIYELQM